MLAEATLAGDAGGRAALDQLCTRYRPPVVSFLLHRGWSPADADDLSQDLFARLLESRAWKRADPAKGRFRNYLLAILRHVVANQVTRAKAQKNGGGNNRISLDWLCSEFDWEPADSGPDPSDEFDHAWAVRILRCAYERVETRWNQLGRAADFAIYRRFLPGGHQAPTYAEVAAALGVQEGAARAAVCRLRTELGEALRQEVAITVASPDDVADEMAYLRNVLARPGLKMPD